MKKPKQFDSQNYTMGNGFMSRPSSADSDWGRVEESRDEEEFQPIRSLDYLVKPDTPTPDNLVRGVRFRKRAAFGFVILKRSVQEL